MINPYGIPQPDFSGVQPLAPQQPPINIAVPKVNRGGMFANADWGSAISAALNGYLAAGGNQAGVLGLQQLHQQRMLQQKQAQQDADYQRQRQDKRDDFTFEQDYKAAHPGPVNNDTVADYNFWKSVLPPDQFQQYVQNKVNPPIMQYVPGIGLIQTRGGESAAPPTSPVGKLTPINGGPTQPASGNFLDNNPGALRVPGSTQFQRFNSPQEGIRAQEALLGRYFQRGRNTVRSVIERYAPRQSVGGDNTDEQVNNYIAYVSKRLGVNPDQPLANVSQLGRAMREFETGKRSF
jgi:hypothetical protein